MVKRDKQRPLARSIAKLPLEPVGLVLPDLAVFGGVGCQPEYKAAA